jgi:hypothetical protein
MRGHHFTNRYRPAVMALAVLMGAGMASDASAQDWGRGAQKEDSRTCERFGADHGRDYTRCMLQQQRRRDNAPLIAAEAQRNNAEAAQRNLQTVRRMKCERAAKRERERGERPRWCD